MQASPTTQLWSTRIAAQEIRRQLESAAKRDVSVMSITVSGTTFLVVVYGVFRKNRMLARCATLEDAAEVAEAVALYRPIH